MHTIRLSLFCAAALLASGVYANDFSDSAGASAKTADLILSPAQDNGARVSAQQQAAHERRQQANFEDSRWVRVSGQGQNGYASREPRLADKTPRWVF
jgi:hypothetical protein